MVFGIQFDSDILTTRQKRRGAGASTSAEGIENYIARK